CIDVETEPPHSAHEALVHERTAEDEEPREPHDALRVLAAALPRPEPFDAPHGLAQGGIANVRDGAAERRSRLDRAEAEEGDVRARIARIIRCPQCLSAVLDEQQVMLAAERDGGLEIDA